MYRACPPGAAAWQRAAPPPPFASCLSQSSASLLQRQRWAAVRRGGGGRARTSATRKEERASCEEGTDRGASGGRRSVPSRAGGIALGLYAERRALAGGARQREAGGWQDAVFLRCKNRFYSIHEIWGGYGMAAPLPFSIHEYLGGMGWRPLRSGWTTILPPPAPPSVPPKRDPQAQMAGKRGTSNGTKRDEKTAHCLKQPRPLGSSRGGPQRRPTFSVPRCPLAPTRAPGNVARERGSCGRCAVFHAGWAALGWTARSDTRDRGVREGGGVGWLAGADRPVGRPSGARAVGDESVAGDKERGWEDAFYLATGKDPLLPSGYRTVRPARRCSKRSKVSRA